MKVAQELVRLFHYHFSDVLVGVSKVEIYAWRCGWCQADFHIDRVPSHCPMCGTEFVDGERRLGA